MDTEKNYYITIERTFLSKIEIKDSKFITYLFPINKPEEVKPILENLWKEHTSAKHICYAYRFDENNYYYYDDGEPSGTAGLRIFTAMRLKNLTYAAIFVVRYFGGTKLGIGPLARAYFDSALGVINKAELVKKYFYKYFEVELNYGQFEKLKSSILKFSLEKPSFNFSDKIIISLSVKQSEVDLFQRFLKNNQVLFRIIDDKSNSF